LAQVRRPHHSSTGQLRRHSSNVFVDDVDDGTQTD
jgi:hypothetical protein